ncbi:MAG TPA: papain-like cysteine protease family protein [Rhizomicrobium sp.]|jgi:hypothetical protein
MASNTLTGRTLDHDKAVAATPPAPATAPLELMVEPQEHSNWCWAAVASGVSKFLDKTDTWPQCSVATAVIGHGCDCCDDYDESTCNVSSSARFALGKTGNLRDWDPLPDDASDQIDQLAQNVAAEMANGLPVCLRVSWDGDDPSDDSEGHFIAVRNVDKNDQDEYCFLTTDPIYGDAHYSVSDFVFAAYGNQFKPDAVHGKWTHTYYTCKSS